MGSSRSGGRVSAEHARKAGARITVGSIKFDPPAEVGDISWNPDDWAGGESVRVPHGIANARSKAFKI